MAIVVGVEVVVDLVVVWNVVMVWKCWKCGRFGSSVESLDSVEVLGGREEGKRDWGRGEIGGVVGKRRFGAKLDGARQARGFWGVR